ncbi:MAG: DKNYY domain-containing protein [Enterobacteriaceae bacterium]
MLTLFYYLMPRYLLFLPAVALLMLTAQPASAGLLEKYSCEDEWYSSAAADQPVKRQSCQYAPLHLIDKAYAKSRPMTRQALKTNIRQLREFEFAEIEGKAYFIHNRVYVKSPTSSGCGESTGPRGPAFNPPILDCLPSRVIEARKSIINIVHQYYFLSEHGSRLRAIERDLSFPVAKEDFNSPFSELYATDGEQVFYHQQAIPGADSQTFRTFFPNHNEIYVEEVWSYDKQQVYYRGKPLPGSSHQDFTLFESEYVISNGKVYRFDEEQKVWILRPDMAPSLRKLSYQVVSDGQALYQYGKKLHGAHGDLQSWTPPCLNQQYPLIPCTDAERMPVEFFKGAQQLWIQETSGGPLMQVTIPDGDKLFYWYGTHPCILGMKSDNVYLLCPYRGQLYISDYVVQKPLLAIHNQLLLIDSVGFVPLNRFPLQSIPALCAEEFPAGKRSNYGAFICRYLSS